MTTRWLLVAHGSPRAAWFSPFEALADELRAGGREVELCYLGHRPPDLEQALTAARGCARLVVWPLFLASGGHITEDIAPAVARFREENPAVEVELYPALLDDAEVRARLVDRASAMSTTSPSGGPADEGS